MKYRIEDRLVEMTVIECCNCGTPFGMTASLNGERLKTGKLFYCPNGHGQSYSETEFDRAKASIAYWERQYEQERGLHQVAENRRRAAVGQITKLRKRAAAGICPCCKRHFTDLERHMHSKHPSFVDEPLP